MSDQLRFHLRGAAWQVLLLSLPLAAILVYLTAWTPVRLTLNPVWQQMTWHPTISMVTVFVVAGLFSLWNLLAFFAALASFNGGALLGIVLRFVATAALLMSPIAVAALPVVAIYTLASIDRPLRKSPA